jgi:CelD/BcsL family acetyltransferase involved in cellulose biosynthesis
MGNVYSERFELLLGDRPQEAAEAIWRYLKAHADRWDVLELRQLPEKSRTLTLLSGFAERDSYAVGCWPSTESPYVEVRDSWESYYKSLKKAHRADVRRRMGRLEQEGPVELDLVMSDRDFDKDFGDAVRLESSAWKGAQGTAIESDAGSKTFYRDILARAAKDGRLRLYFLTVGGKRIAVRIGLFFHNRLFMLKSGYDPEYAAFSPSHLLCDKVIREAWNLQFAEADFLGNAERWKLSWSTNVRAHHWLFIFPRRPVPWTVHALKFRLLPRIHRTPVYVSLRRAASRLGIAIHEE